MDPNSFDNLGSFCPSPINGRETGAAAPTLVTADQPMLREKSTPHHNCSECCSIYRAVPEILRQDSSYPENVFKRDFKKVDILREADGIACLYLPRRIAH